MAGVVKETIGAVKSEFKISKIVAFVVMLVVAGFILSWLSKKNQTVANLNPLVVK